MSGNRTLSILLFVLGLELIIVGIIFFRLTQTVTRYVDYVSYQETIQPFLGIGTLLVILGIIVLFVAFKRNKAQIASIILILAYVAIVYSFLPLPSLSIVQTPSFTTKATYSRNYVTIEVTIRDFANRSHLVVGDLVVFSFNITNTYSQPATFDYNSSVTFLYYGKHRTFVLNASQSEDIDEKLPARLKETTIFSFKLCKRWEIRKTNTVFP